MTLAELQEETLKQKHIRLQQEKCKHGEIYSSAILTPEGSSETRVCLDCGKSWHSSLIAFP